jgi:hypothetical protein
MSAWAWVLVGAGTWFALSLLVGVALAVTLKRMSIDLSELEPEPWASSSPLMRDDETEEEPRTAEAADSTAKGSARAVISRRSG